jgi:hypothetical protein
MLTPFHTVAIMTLSDDALDQIFRKARTYNS